MRVAAPLTIFAVVSCTMRVSPVELLRGPVEMLRGPVELLR